MARRGDSRGEEDGRDVSEQDEREPALVAGPEEEDDSRTEKPEDLRKECERGGFFPERAETLLPVRGNRENSAIAEYRERGGTSGRISLQDVETAIREKAFAVDVSDGEDLIPASKAMPVGWAIRCDSDSPISSQIEAEPRVVGRVGVIERWGEYQERHADPDQINDSARWRRPWSHPLWFSRFP